MEKKQITLERRGTSHGYDATLNDTFHLEFMPYQNSTHNISIEIVNKSKGKAVFRESFSIRYPLDNNDDLRTFIVDAISSFCDLDIEFTNFPEKLYDLSELYKDPYIANVYHIQCSQFDAMTEYRPVFERLNINNYITDGGMHVYLRLSDICYLHNFTKMKDVVFEPGKLPE